jgi:hypothetical protein
MRSARVERLSEHRDALRQDDPVDPVLQAVVFAADMELSEGILRDLRRLQDHLIEQGVVPARRRRIAAESIV